MGGRDISRQPASGSAVAATQDPGLGPGKRTLTQSLDPQVGEKRPPLLVDGEPTSPGQLAKLAFLDQLHGQVVAAASSQLAPASADTCPYIEQYFARYRQATAADVLAVIGRFAPAARSARTAGDLIAPLIARIQDGIQKWKATGRLPADLEAQAPGAATAASKPTTMRSLESELGPGQALDAGTAGRMSTAMGSDVSAARVHTGPDAARKAAEVDASAFAVGEHVVFGPGAYQPGTLAGDALLAHELAHVAQQADAARDPAARDKPIGSEAQGPERAADGRAMQAMSQLHGGDRNTGGKLTWDDLLTTGLQLQRCPATWPAGPPMSGKEADQKIADVPLIADMIHNDVQRGFTGDKLVHLYDDFDAYVNALMTEVGVIQMIPADKRREATREFAATAKGFTDPATRKVYIYTKDTPAFVTIHELMHVYTAANHLSGTGGLGEHFVEGTADYFTRMVCRRSGAKFKSAYPKELVAVEALVAQIGEDTLAALTFHGATDPVKAILDSKAPGTWKAYQKAMKSDSYPDAADLITGAAGANAARVEHEEAEAAKAEAALQAKADADAAEDRKTWPPEGTAPMRGRILSKMIHGDQTRLMIGVGATNGVRETWMAHIKLTDGSTLDAKVVKVARRTASIDVDSKLVPAIIEPIEVRPKAP